MTVVGIRLKKAIVGGLFLMTAGLHAPPAAAEILTFTSTLNGTYGAVATGSSASGAARIKVDTDRQSVSVDMTVDGITVDALWDKLVAAPIGPVHFHKYAAAGGDSMLVLPLPYGRDYHPTQTGMRLTLNDYAYVAGAEMLKSTLTFDEFVAAMRSGLVVLNVHTDAFNPGEIGGLVVEELGRRETLGAGL